ncbi:MAG: adenosine deaminase [Acidobacteriota bacterium]
MAPLLADCHLHFEGSLPLDVVQSLAGRARHPFAEPGAFPAARDAVRDSGGFLALFAEICRLFRTPEDYRDAASRLARSLAAGGVAYAEVYVSPEICGRIGLDPGACLAAVDAGFGEKDPSDDFADCRILLDTVRHWGAEAAERVLDVHERRPLPRVVGFGMGGDEASHPASEFAGAYARARSIGLKTSVHAGEWQGAHSVRSALDALRPDRIDHGIAAASDASLLERLADETVPLFVAPTGNVRTGAVAGFADHPFRRLLAAGVAVAISADDPLLFSTTTAGEYSAAATAFGLDDEALRETAARSWRGAFGLSAQARAAGASALSSWSPGQAPPSGSST